MKPHTSPPPGRARYDDGVVHRPHDDGHGHDDMHNVDVGHEHSDVNIRAIVMSVVILVVVGIVSQIAMYLLFGWFERSAAANEPVVSPLAVKATEMPKTTTTSPAFSQGVGGPQLLTNEPMALRTQREDEQKKLHGYAWVNQGGGVAQIPIEQAKKLVAERGLPVRAGDPPPATLGTRLPARGESTGGRIITEPLAEPAAAPPSGAAPQPGHEQQQPQQPSTGHPAQDQQPAARPHPGGGA